MSTSTLQLNNSALPRGYRVEFLNGQTYRVAPVTLIVPGVLAGNKGALYYPPEQVVKDYESWNGFPIVVNHPTLPDGQGISARSPGVADKQQVGTLYSAHINNQGKLAAEAWFEEKATKRIDKRIWEKLERQEPIEVSTGLYTTNLVAPQGANYRGKSYTHIATNYKPDHLAVLPDTVGACSVQDGCGVFNQATPPKKQGKTKMIPATREEKINYLTTNCDCWKCKGDEETLNGFTDEKLEKLCHNRLTLNALSTNADESEMEEEDEEDSELETPTPPNKKPKKGKKAMTENTLAEWMENDLSSAPVEVQNAVKAALKIELAERTRVANMLVTNAAPEKKAALHTKLMTKSLGELQDILDLQAQTRQQTNNSYNPAPNYSGLYEDMTANTQQSFTNNANEEDDILLPNNV